MTPLIIGIIILVVYTAVLIWVYNNEKKFNQELKEKNMTVEDFFDPKNTKKKDTNMYNVISDSDKCEKTAPWTGHDFTQELNDYNRKI